MLATGITQDIEIPSCLLFGSVAMKHWWPYYPNEPKDVDILTFESNTDEYPIGYEVHKLPDALFESILKFNGDYLYVGPNILYTIKLSHLPWEGKNGKWWKHLKDFHFMQNNGCQKVDWFLPLLDHFWKKKFGDKGEINLNQGEEEFFNSNISRFIPHDEMHEMVKIGDVPAFKQFQSGHNVQVCKYMFEELPEDVKLASAVEESCVVALERNLSYANGFKHVVTRLSKGWWNTYAIENSEQILNEGSVYFNSRREEWKKNFLIS